VFPDFSAHLGDRWATTDDLALAILGEAGVATVSGESFGMPGFLRLSYATSDEEVERGMTAITELLARG
jgi:aspartate aminotransferase